MQQRETLHERIYKDILAQLYEGELPVNSSLPTIEKLCSTYQVGDKCIRVVIGRLRENGYLSTARGRPARILFNPNAPAQEKQLFLEFSCDKAALYAYYEAIHILFPPIYTRASMTCTNVQLEELNRIIPSPASGGAPRLDYVELNIRFFKTICDSIKNPLILYIVRTVMQTTVLPAALMQRKVGQLEEAFTQSAAIMRCIYTAVVENDPLTVKKQWERLFEITEIMTKEAAESCRDIPAQAQTPPAGLQYASEYKYLLIARDLYEKILEGKYPVGALLPAISKAQGTYGVSKVTIQTAYRVLSEFGIVRTTNGRGTKVIRLVIESTFGFDEVEMNCKNTEYLEAIDFLQTVCGALILHLSNSAMRALRENLESNLNPGYQHSTLILCRTLMNGTDSSALGSIYQVLSVRLYWDSQLKRIPEELSLAERHFQCVEIADALERQQTERAISLTKELLAALYRNGQRHGMIG